MNIKLDILTLNSAQNVVSFTTHLLIFLHCTRSVPVYSIVCMVPPPHPKLGGGEY